jgi:hypothetical protein
MMRFGSPLQITLLGIQFNVLIEVLHTYIEMNVNHLFLAILQVEASQVVN